MAVQASAGSARLYRQRRGGGGSRPKQERAAHPSQDVLQPAEDERSSKTPRALKAPLVAYETPGMDVRLLGHTKDIRTTFNKQSMHPTARLQEVLKVTLVACETPRMTLRLLGSQKTLQDKGQPAGNGCSRKNPGCLTALSMASEAPTMNGRSQG